MDRLLEILGGFFGWCYSNYDGWGYMLKYWLAEEKTFYRWILSNRPLIILAGYMSRNRGLHWDRKRG